VAIIAEYLWIDGTVPTSILRSKTKVIHAEDTNTTLSTFEDWAFDGSSTNQAPGNESDRLLKPIRFAPDPVRGDGAYLVMCEVLNPDGTPHHTNKRSELVKLVEGREDSEPWVAFEQEYTFFKGASPLGFPAERRYPAPQGPYYCGVGADEVYGRAVVEDHLSACLRAGLALTGINAEVMPGQWEFQCGGPGIDPLTASDHLWMARWLLYRIGEDYSVSATLDPKPVPGDWNGAGMHTNFSTAKMRQTGLGLPEIERVCEALGQTHDQHLEVYGAGNESRLTGRHETASFKNFFWGVADRTASIRIPLLVARDKSGYLEDRRPAANADPYSVCSALMKTTFGLWG